MPVGWNLEEFHVLKRDAAPVDDRRAVPGQAVRVAGHRPDTPPAAGGEQRRLCVEDVQLACAQFERDDAADRAVVHDQVDDVKLVEEGDVVLDALLVERLQDHVPGAVGGVAGAPDGLLAEIAGVTAKAPLADLAVGCAVEGQAHVLQLDHRVDGVFRQHVRGVLVSQVIATLDGIVGVPERLIFLQIAERRADAALRRAGVAARGVELADHGDLRAAFAGIKGCHQSGAACADDDRLILMCLHKVASNPYF